MPTVEAWLYMGIASVLITCSALMSASEIAFFSITHAEREELRESDDSATARVVKLLDRPRYLLSTILIGNNIVNIGVIILSYFIVTGIFNFQDIAIGTFVFPKATFDFLVNVVVVTFFLVLFGEAIPKVYASHNKFSIARGVSRLFIVLNRLLTPINYIQIGRAHV